MTISVRCAASGPGLRRGPNGPIDRHSRAKTRSRPVARQSPPPAPGPLSHVERLMPERPARASRPSCRRGQTKTRRFRPLRAAESTLQRSRALDVLACADRCLRPVPSGCIRQSGSLRGLHRCSAHKLRSALCAPRYQKTAPEARSEALAEAPVAGDDSAPESETLLDGTGARGYVGQASTPT